MPSEIFVLKSLLIQNTIMAIGLGVILVLLFLGIKKKNIKQIIVSFVWAGLGLWFFNSSMWGFSTVTIARQGIKLQYGFLSFKNTVIPVNTPWEIKTENAGFPKYRKLYVLKFGDHKSMRLSAMEYPRLKQITEILKNTAIRQ